MVTCLFLFEKNMLFVDSRCACRFSGPRARCFGRVQVDVAQMIWCACFAHAQGDRRRQGPKLPKLWKKALLMYSVCAVKRSTIKGHARQK